MSTAKIALRGEPLSLRETLDCGQAFRWREESDGSFSGIVGGRAFNLSADGDAISVTSGDGLAVDETFWKNYFALDISYSDLHKAYRKDEVLSRCVDFAPGIRVLRQDFFEVLISFIISQNNNIPRIKAIIERLCDSFGDETGGDETGGAASAPRRAFPLPERLASLSPDDLAPLRAGYRAEFILRTSRAISENPDIVREITGAETPKAREILLRFHGVGPKVADCVLLFGLGRFEAFPVDVWIKRAMAQLFPGGLPPQACSTAGIAQQYIFNYARSLM